MSNTYPRFVTALAFIAIFFYGCSEKKTPLKRPLR